MATADMDEAGARESAPVIYRWPWYWHLSRLALWLVLALAVAWPRTNRDRQALLIFIPLLVLSLLWRSITKGMGMGAVELEEFSLFFESLVVGTALLWLNADKLGRYHGMMRFVMSLGLMLLAGLAGLIAYDRVSSDDAGPFLGLILVMSIILLVALAVTRRRAHGRYEPPRFMLHLALWDMLCSLVGVIAVFLVLETLTGFPKTPDPQSTISEAIPPGLILGICLYAINLPYMLLMFRSPFFRRRFQMWLGVDSASLHSGRMAGTPGS